MIPIASLIALRSTAVRSADKIMKKVARNLHEKRLPTRMFAAVSRRRGASVAVNATARLVRNYRAGIKVPISDCRQRTSTKRQVRPPLHGARRAV